MDREEFKRLAAERASLVSKQLLGEPLTAEETARVEEIERQLNEAEAGRFAPSERLAERQRVLAERVTALVSKYAPYSEGPVEFYWSGVTSLDEWGS